MQLGVGGGVIRGRRNGLVLQAQDRLDQAGHSGCGVKVADVGLHRAEYAWARAVELCCLECLSQGFDFDWIAERGSGAMGLDESDG